MMSSIDVIVRGYWKIKYGKEDGYCVRKTESIRFIDHFVFFGGTYIEMKQCNVDA